MFKTCRLKTGFFLKLSPGGIGCIALFDKSGRNFEQLANSRAEKHWSAQQANEERRASHWIIWQDRYRTTMVLDFSVDFGSIAETQSYRHERRKSGMDGVSRNDLCSHCVP
jgi:hypothetical protein